jgi:superfamily I DNA/RNA helicase
LLKRITLKGEQKKVLFLPPTNPIQIKGVAGSGKTTVALYRAKHLLETQANLFKETKIVIFTYNKTLAAYIKAIKPYINGGYQKDSDEIRPKTADGLNVQIINFHSWAYHFSGIQYNQTVMQWTQIEYIENIISGLTSSTSNILDKSTEFFQEEISWIKGKLFKDKSEYLEAARTGRGTSDRVTKTDKEVIWVVYGKYNQELKNRGEVDFDDYAILALRKIQKTPNFIPPYTHIIIDEAQDLNKAQILAISSLVDPETNSLSIIADAAQRIFKSGFVWSEVGINVRGGRTIEFKKNYRNSIHIARAALSLLDKEIDKSEFTNVETALKGGEKPKIAYYSDLDEQLEKLLFFLTVLKKQNNLKSTVVLHRSRNGVTQIKRFLDDFAFATELVKSSLPVNYGSDSVKICTMSSIKGLEFNNVFILDLNDDIIPYPPGFIEEGDEFHISTERRLLYTCMTRARNKLFLFSSDKDNPSRYLKEIDSDLLNDISPKSNSTASSTYNDDLPF